MIAGRFPFHGLSEYLTWQKIKRLEYSFPEGFDEEAKDLVQKLLVCHSYLRAYSHVIDRYYSTTSRFSILMNG